MRRAAWMGLFGLFCALFIAYAYGEDAPKKDDPKAREIMEKSERMWRAESERAFTVMKNLDEEGRAREQELSIFRKPAEGDNDKLLVRFTDPARIRGTGLLTVERSDDDDDQWLYLPSLRKIKRIASSDKNDYFAGTDFTYEDVRTEDLERMVYELTGEGECEGEKCHIVTAYPATPKRAEESGYSKRVIYIRCGEYIPVRIEFYDKGGRHQKTLKMLDYRKVNGLWRHFHSEMEHHIRNTKTVWDSKEREVNVKLSDDLFTKRTLERFSPEEGKN